MNSKLHIEKILGLLYSADDYDKAMQYFFDKMATDPELMNRSIKPPANIIAEIIPVYEGTLQQIGTKLGFPIAEMFNSIKFFYLKEQNFLHGMMMSQKYYGATLYFPSLKKGALALFEVSSGITHYVRVTSLNSSTEA